MPLFWSPNIDRLRARGNIKGLIKTLRYGRDPNVRREAAVGGADCVHKQFNRYHSFFLHYGQKEE
jgi:hypothetical protein